MLSVELAVSPDAAWRAFALEFDRWWPVGTHSLSRLPGTRCRLDCAPGGTVDELGPDGARHLWGTVEAAEPGRRIAFSWHPGREPASAQRIEVLFEATAAGSRVTLTHGGWDALGEIGPLLRQEYVAGWQQVFAVRYAGYAASRQARESPP